MTTHPASFTTLSTAEWPAVTRARRGSPSSVFLPAAITKAASKQTYYTIRYLVDRDRIPDAYRTYAYFRWVDDQLDEHLTGHDARQIFLQRQQAIMDRCYRGEHPGDVTVEERMLVDLIRSDPNADSGVHTYIRHMMAVMAFDADRRGRLITQSELDAYTRDLAVAVTEAMHYFIGHDWYAPIDDTRYAAVMGAHITHMLRDMLDDTAAGYYNIPREVLKTHVIDVCDVHSDAYRMWVRERVQLARTCFETGADYLKRVENRRCRLAGYAYMARFQSVLDVIEREDYTLRPDYLERKTLRGSLRMAGTLLALLVGDQFRGKTA